VAHHNKVTEAEIREMKFLFSQGLGVCEIARRVKRHRRVVGTYLGTNKPSAWHPNKSLEAARRREARPVKPPPAKPVDDPWRDGGMISPPTKDQLMAGR
jgi:hypothetical protein